MYFFLFCFKIACNRTYTGLSGQIYSPGWPGRYPQNANCQFRIQAPVGTTVSLYFNTFHIEPHTNCNFDYLQVSFVLLVYYLSSIFFWTNSFKGTGLRSKSIKTSNLDFLHASTWVLKNACKALKNDVCVLYKDIFSVKTE
jgi:hypothetical protein